MRMTACLVVALVAVAVPPSAPVLAAAPVPRAAVLFTGDDLATPATWATAHQLAGGDGYEYRPMFARLRPLVSSVDLAICHLETPLMGPGVPLSDYPNYAVPRALARAIRWAGYDGCSTASNHSLDHGAAGIASTLDALDRLGLGHTGTRRGPDERRYARYPLGGGDWLAHLSSTWSFNGHVPSAPWQANRIDVARILADARLARRRGAGVVVLSLHWGVEHQHGVAAAQSILAERLLRTDAIDLIVGHHAHVVQPVRRVHGTVVAYGMGNSLSGMTAAMFSPGVQDGVAVLATFAEGPRGWHLDRVRYAPTWVEPYRWVIRPVGPALDAGRLPAAVLTELRRSWARTVATVDAAAIDVRPYRRAVWRW